MKIDEIGPTAPKHWVHSKILRFRSPHKAFYFLRAFWTGSIGGLQEASSPGGLPPPRLPALFCQTPRLGAAAPQIPRRRIRGRQTPNRGGGVEHLGDLPVCKPRVMGMCTSDKRYAMLLFGSY